MTLVGTASRRERRAAGAVTGLAACLVLAACTSSSSGDQPPTVQPTGSASSSPSSSPSPTGPAPTIDEAAIKAVLDTTAKELQTPGAVVLVRSPQGNVELAYGTTTLGGSTPVTVDDHVRIGSNTKTFTGTVILQLVQEGKIKLTAPVSTYWPGVPNGQHITITQLLDMRSGLYNYSETLALNLSLDRTPARVWTPKQLLALAFAHPPYFAPGKGYHYSNTNTVLLGLIAEKIERKPLATIFQDRFFGPLQLASTSFPPSTTAAIPAPFARGYMYGTNVQTMATAALPAAQQAAVKAGTLKPFDVTNENPSWTWAAGQVISTARDMATWVTALGDGGVLAPELQLARLKSVQPADASLPSGAQYGLAIAKLGPVYGHTGELPGYNSVMGYDPASKLTLVVWTNLGSSADGRAVATTIAKQVLAQLYPSGG